ncbi:MAG: beta-ketoacyl synthase N-terminal-like domain-containing protein, partial [Thermoanaerobaculum sp.]
MLGIGALGVVSGAGMGLDALKKALEQPDFQAPLGLPRPDGPPLPVVTCTGFDTKGVLPPLVARRLDRPSRLLAVAAKEALSTLGAELPWPREQVGVCAGTWNAGTEALVEILKAVFTSGPEEAPPMHFPNSVANAAASQLGILEKLGGPNLTFFEKQASGLRAILEAKRFLENGRAQAMLAAGVDEAQWLNAECFQRLRSLRQPSGDGLLLGEGAAVLLLTREQSAVKIAGDGAAAWPTSPHRYPENPRALVSACHKALAEAGLAPAQVELVVSLANGSPALAQLEQAALLELFGTHRPAVLGGLAERLGEGGFSSALRVLAATL